MEPSQELILWCREVFLKCGEFASHDSLQAIFVTSELRPIKDDLPHCKTKKERVDQTIFYLLSQRLSGNRQVFPYFLDALKLRYAPMQQTYQDLQELHDKFSEVFSDKIIVPFVVAAMIKSEAENLVEGNTLEEKEQFEKFHQTLKSLKLGNLSSYYNENRESWKPPFSSNRSIKKIINETIDSINSRYRKPEQLPDIHPLFLTDDFFSDDVDIRRNRLKILRQSGGVLIMDAISMFHPSVFNKVKGSDFGSKNQVALLFLSPYDSAIHEVNRLIENLLEQEMETAHTRMTADWDLACEMAFGGLRNLKRWLCAVLPEMSKRIAKEEPNREKLNKLFKKKIRAKTNIGDAIFNPGETQ